MASPLRPVELAAPVSEPGEGAHLPVAAAGAGCLEIVSARLSKSPGVVAVEADFRNGTLRVRYHPALIELDRLNALADEVGALFAQRVTSCERRASLGSCEECALRLGKVDEAVGREFDVTVEPHRVGLQRKDASGHHAEVVRPLTSRKSWGARNSPAEQAALSKGATMAIFTGVCFVAMIAGMVVERMGLAAVWHESAFLVAAVTGGWFALRSTIRALAKLRFDVNLLMILAAAGAAVIGYTFEAAVLMFLFSLSNTMEVYTMGRTRRALHALLKLRPVRALVRRGGQEVEVEAEDVLVGEQVIVKPGEAVPVDGEVVSGESLIDQSHLTGESVPVPKQPGDPVYAGTLNQQGAIVARTTRAAGDTTLARIVQLVTDAQEQKSRTEEIADWVGRYYTVAVVVAAALMIVVPPFVLGEDFVTAFYRAMTLLVVASPCALVIATPATILSAISNAARHGILFKGGRFIEALGRVRAIAFDKTGTLTHGRFAVTDVRPIGGVSEEEVLAWAASAERRSQHPLAQAVVRAADERGIQYVPATELTSHLGKGLVARLDGGTVEIGTPSLFQHLGIDVPEEAQRTVAAFAAEAKTAMLVRHGEQWGVLAAADQIRPVAVETIGALRRLSVRVIALLSGDSQHTVEAIARQVHVDEYYGALLPEDKVRVIAEMEERHGAVAMVGDGVNDAPALARATVGVAMGGIGSDAAMESADVVLMGDDLTSLPYAVKLSQRARRVVIQNVIVAAGVMVLLVLWVFFGHLTPLGALKLPIAVSGHEGSTVVVILNGLRLLRGSRVG